MMDEIFLLQTGSNRLVHKVCLCCMASLVWVVFFKVAVKKKNIGCRGISLTRIGDKDPVCHVPAECFTSHMRFECLKAAAFFFHR